MGLNIGVIGCGAKAAQYIDAWVAMESPPSIVAISDPDSSAMDNAAKSVTKGGQMPPARFETTNELIQGAAAELDAVYICTPHAFHHAYAIVALDAGLDVLLEKPMAMSSKEAHSLLKAQKKAGRTIVIAYQGSLSPLFERVRQDADRNVYGELLAINGVVWENWATTYAGSWKQDKQLSGGGFVFDTGSHLLNAANDLSRLDFTSVSARLHSRACPVDILGSVRAELAGGVPVSLTFCGDSIQERSSALTLFFTKAIVDVDIWGAWLSIRSEETNQRYDFKDDNRQVLESFIKVREGRLKNPSPPEASVSLSELWEAIQTSSENNGSLVCLKDQ